MLWMGIWVMKISDEDHVREQNQAHIRKKFSPGLFTETDTHPQARKCDFASRDSRSPAELKKFST